MKLNNSFWKLYELDMQEIKRAYLNWAIGYAKEPKLDYQHLFRWDHQDRFCPINSRYGRAFSFSPFGLGVRGVPRPKFEGIPRGLDEIDIALKARLTENTRLIRISIENFLKARQLNDARQMVLNFYWLKLGAHELLFNRIQLKQDKSGKIKKGRWGLDEAEKWRTLTGIPRITFGLSGRPWVFWHRYWSRKHGRFVEGPYGDRKKLMKRLCKKAGVRYFRFHPIRHSGASIMDGNGVPLGAIQRILGHENRKTTEIYLHSMGDSERDAMRVFEQARQKSPHFPHTGT